MTLSRGITVSIIGSLLGLAMMDAVMALEFSLFGLPKLTYLELIGSVFRGGALAGVLGHLLLGILMGLVVGIAVVKVDALGIDSLEKGVLIGVAVGVLTIPFGCVPFALLIGQPVLQVLGFSTIPHLVWGLGLGVVAGYGLIGSARLGD
jgi:hypothetical protein